MERADILDLLAEHTTELAEQHAVASLAIFGSFARAQADTDSDVDILVEFSQPVGLFEFVRLQAALEAILGRPVDLVTLDAVRPEMKHRIMAEAITVG